jgi:hypothetical protein
MSESDSTLHALARLEASLTSIEEAVRRADEKLARLRRIEHLVEQIALGMGIRTRGQPDG